MTLVPTPQTADPGEFVYGLDDDGLILSRRVGVEEINYTGRFGATVTSTSEHTVSIGEKYFTIDIDDDKFRVGDDVLITAIDPDCYMWGEVIGKDTVASPARLRIFIDDISPVTATFTGWTIQVVARPKPGIEKDTSTSSNNPTTGGPWTFTVTAGKFFPIGGTLLIKPTTDRSIAVIGEVKAYNGTSLTVSLRTTNATVSQAYTSWSIALLDSPPANMPFYGISGLEVTLDNSVAEVTVAAGSVMDSTDSVLMTLDTFLWKDLTASFTAGSAGGGIVKVALTGTVSSAGTTVTGTGTTFEASLKNATMDGFVDLVGDVLPTPAAAMISTSDAKGAKVAGVTSDTILTASASLAASGDTFSRGATTAEAFAISSQYIAYVAIIRKDSDGTIDVCVTSATPSGDPDLPSGYTYYRIIAGFYTNDNGATHTVIHPVHSVSGVFATNNFKYILAGTAPSTYINNSLPNNYYIDASGSAGVAPSFDATARTVQFNVANNAVTNTKLNDMAAYTLKGRNAGTTGDPSDIDISALTEKVTVADADLFLIQDSAASNAFKKVQKVNIGGGTTFPSDMGLITEAATTTFDCGTIV